MLIEADAYSWIWIARKFWMNDNPRYTKGDLYTL